MKLKHLIIFVFANCSYAAGNCAHLQPRSVDMNMDLVSTGGNSVSTLSFTTDTFVPHQTKSCLECYLINNSKPVVYGNYTFHHSLKINSGDYEYHNQNYWMKYLMSEMKNLKDIKIRPSVLVTYGSFVV